MKLTLSTTSPLNALYATKDGQVRFKVETKIVSGSSTEVSKVSCLMRSCEGESRMRNSTDVSMDDELTHITDVEHNTISPSVFRFGGREIDARNYFRKETWGAYGRHRIFIGPDGREYRWLISTCAPELIVNNKSKALVARFSPSSSGGARGARQASLEVFPPGEHMVETILVTLLYVEKVRRTKKRGAGPARSQDRSNP